MLRMLEGLNYVIGTASAALKAALGNSKDIPLGYGHPQSLNSRNTIAISQPISYHRARPTKFAQFIPTMMVV